MKAFAEDTESFKLRAIGIAWNTDPGHRAAALTTLFEDCGTAAGVYADPASVVVLFVNAVSETYAAEFMAQRQTA
jgi:hypothetical protein